MQRRAGVSAVASAWRIVFGLALVVFLPSTGRGIEVPGSDPPSPPIPERNQRLFAVNVHTGEVAFDQAVQGKLQAASLSEGDRVAYALSEPGSPLLRPRSKIFTQAFSAPAPSQLTSQEEKIFSVGVTDSRVMWSVDDSFHYHYEIHSLADGTSTSHAGLVFDDFRLARDVAILVDRNVSGFKVVVHDLITGELANHLNVVSPLLRIASPRGFDANRDSIVGVLFDLATDKSKVAKLSPNAPAEYLPFSASNFATNGSQIVFNGRTTTDGSPTGLYLYDSGISTLLATSQELGDVTGSTSEFSISENSIAWRAGSLDDGRIWIRDIASGVARQLPTAASGLQFWDLNNDYILLSSDAISFPEPCGCLLLAAPGG